MEAHPGAIDERPNRLSSFLATLADRLDLAGEDLAPFLREASSDLKALVEHDDWLDEEFAQPHPDHGIQYLLYCDPLKRFSVVSVVWGPGHGTPIHDHTVWGLVGALRGAELEEIFEIRDGKPVCVGEARLEAGDIVTLSPQAGDIHRVRNAFDDRPSVSIHVYGGDIGGIERHIFPAEGGVQPFKTSYANRLLPNPWYAAA
jgi:predicted metal-dependent enzyme (double-stranded beta helix superfamily)